MNENEANDTIKRFYKLSKKKQIKVLFEALDYMEAHNGRSRWECIELAMPEKEKNNG